MELYYNQHSEPQNLNKQQIETLVHDAFTEESISSGKQVQITGFNSLIFNLVYQFIKNTIRFDIARHEQDQFSNVQSEVEINHIINNIRFKGYIDRIDQTADTINIIDYKTTTSKTKANINILDLFTSYESAYHELFQIILYCNIYNSSFLTPHSSLFIAHCYDQPKQHILHACPPASDVVVMVGPDGDFSEEEVELALRNSFQAITLGESRLRTETAGVVACHLVTIANVKSK
jgi:hypothetical protein